METEHERWSRIFSGPTFFYGQEPGSVARRALKYARSLNPEGGTALDAGCGEGQDLLFLARNGYDSLGLDFTGEGIAKARRLLDDHSQTARLEVADLTQWNTDERFDLVLCINALQFMGSKAPQVLKNCKPSSPLVECWVFRPLRAKMRAKTRSMAPFIAFTSTNFS